MGAFDWPTINDVDHVQWRTWSEESKHEFFNYWRSQGISCFHCLSCGFPVSYGVASCVSCRPSSP